MKHRPLPFRSELRTAAATAADGHGLTADEACLDIDLSIEADAADIETWLRHPDERVATGALDRLRTEKLGTEQWLGAHVRDAHAQVVDVLLDLADEEGLVWTPLLDQARRELCWQSVAEGNPLPVREQVADRLERLAAWARHASGEEMDMLLDAFEWPALDRAVAASAPNLGLERMRAFAEDAKLFDCMAANPTMCDRRREWILRRALRSEHRNHQSVWDALNRAGHVLPPRVLEAELLRPIRRRTEQEKRIAEGAGSYAERTSARLTGSPARQREAGIRMALTGLNRLTAADLMALAPPQGKDEHGTEDSSWIAIGSHPAADREVLMLVAKHTHGQTQSDILARLARIEEVRATPELAAWLIGEGDWRCHIELADRLTAAQIRALEGHLCADTAWRAREVKEWLIDRADAVPHAALPLLLSHPDRSVRLLATTLLGPDQGERARLRPSAQPRAEEPTPARPAGTKARTS